MNNPMLERTILKILDRVNCGLREKTLQAETEIAYDRRSLTSDEFIDALISLEDKALMRNRKNLIGETVWGITEAGKAALKGI